MHSRETKSAGGAPGGRPTAQDRILAGSSRRELWILCAILILGALLRGIHLTEFRRAPDFTQPQVDADLHNYWARGLAFSDWEPKNDNPDPEIRTTPYFRPPGYPYLLALLYTVGGPGFIFPRLVQMGFGLLSALLAFRIARPRLGPLVALLWAGMMATYPVFIYFEAEFQEPAIFICLLLLLLGQLLAWGERPSWLRALLSGVLLGLAGLIRPNALLLLPAAALWMLRTGSPRRWRMAGALLLAAGLAILPATLRNWAVAHEFVPISTNGGINLFIGNNQSAQGLVVANTEVGTLDTCYDWPDIVRNLSRKLGRPVTHAEASRWFQEQAIAFMSSHPATTAGLLLRKAALFLGPLEPQDNKILQGERTLYTILRVSPWSFPLVLSLGLSGIALWVYRARSREAAGAAPGDRGHALLRLSLLFAVTWILSFLPFAVTARYRAPLVPLLLLFAAMFLTSVAGEWRRGTRQRSFPWIAAAGVLLVLTHVNFAGYEPSLARWHYQRGIAYKNLGQLPAARSEYELALAENPNHLGATRDLGAALASLGRIGESIPYFERAVQRDQSHAVTWMNLATAYEATGRDEEAVAAYGRVVELVGNAPRARQGIARIESRRGAVPAGGTPPSR